MTTRPIQEMSYLSASVRAAREVQADTLSPDFFRQAMEWYSKARREYKIKNFSLAKEYSIKARYLAEQAEFDALRHGGVRAELSSGAPPTQHTSPPSPYPYQTPTPTPAEGADAQQPQTGSPAGNAPGNPPGAPSANQPGSGAIASPVPPSGGPPNPAP